MNDPDTPARKPRKRQEAAHLRRLAFAAASCRLGTASAAYREIYPSSRAWLGDSVSREAARLMRHPDVKAEIDRINTDARLDAIASRQEIASLLAEIMRGNVMQSQAVKVRNTDGSQGAIAVDMPPPVSQRIRAARELERMLPAVLPPEPSAAAAQDDTSSTLDDRLADIRKRRSQTSEVRSQKT